MRPGRKNDRRTFDDLRTAPAIDFNPARTSKLAEPGDDFDAAFLEQSAKSSHQSLYRLILASQSGAPIDLGLRGNYPELSCVAHGAIHLCDVQPLLGRDTATNKTGSTRSILFYKGDGQPEVVGIQGRGVPTGASPHNDNVVQV